MISLEYLILQCLNFLQEAHPYGLLKLIFSHNFELHTFSLQEF